MQNARLLLLHWAVDSATYAAEHDRAVWTTLQRLGGARCARTGMGCGTPGRPPPRASGGLGLALAPAAWADTLPVLQQRRPDAARLIAEGWDERPEWDALLRGARPPPTHLHEPSEPGGWPHGWQKLAARGLNTSYRERLLCSLSPSCWALLRCQAGAHAGEWLRAIPTEKGTQILPLDKHPALRKTQRSGDAFACRCPCLHPGVANTASQAAEPWSTSWAITAPPVPGC